MLWTCISLGTSFQDVHLQAQSGNLKQAQRCRGRASTPWRGSSSSIPTLGSASAPSGSRGRRGPLAAPHPAAAPGHFSARGWSGCCFFPHFLHSCRPSAPPGARSSLRAGRGGGEQTCGGRARAAERARAGEDGRPRAGCVSAACRPCARVRGSGRCASGRELAVKLRPARSRAGGDGDARGRRWPGIRGLEPRACGARLGPSRLGQLLAAAVGRACAWTRRLRLAAGKQHRQVGTPWQPGSPRARDCVHAPCFGSFGLGKLLPGPDARAEGR